ncbi:MAG TPA: DNA mismatch repair endonuclease MutL [Chitinophagales bacterium]|nr:DNA mismatch repair endonuclease MutL [Chitinophagales bacterium]
MPDIIKLLPDSIANQIAAGEVVQRPASVVKELMENAIDAGATHVQLIVKEAGKKLIQVIDNGSGMSETDARLCFERHATSKITNAADLFAIRTMGFRGEAMASIAAVAQVELKTRPLTAELGTLVQIEASEIKLHEPCHCAQGTAISVKNLFFNVPARRNFLKSDAIEYKYILEEFQRIALANPTVGFKLFHNGAEVYNLPADKLKKRIVGILGASYNERMVAVELESDFLRLFGFVGKPEFAKKTRGDQFFFVNERYIKSSYLHHAVMSAYEKLIPEQTYPFYLVFIDIEPARIDVNVHPTKQEIKFDNEQVIYTLIKTSVARALGQHNITPTLDFETDVNIPSIFTPLIHSNQKEPPLPPTKERENKKDYLPTTQKHRKSVAPNWEELYRTPDIPILTPQTEQPAEQADFETDFEDTDDAVTNASGMQQTITLPAANRQTNDQDTPLPTNQALPFQLHNAYVLYPIKSGFVLIDQQLASERILYERYMQMFNNNLPASQQLLFPQTLDLSKPDAELLRLILPDITALGFDIAEFGQHSFVLRGVPSQAGMLNQDSQHTIELLLEQFKINLANLKTNNQEALALTMAKSNALKRGEKLPAGLLQTLADQLFACQMPYVSPTGKPTFIEYALTDIEKQFERKRG